MSSKDQEWDFRIYDILKAIGKIEIYISKMKFTQFSKNELVIDAVIRNFEIIGEAANKVPIHIRRTYKDIPWEQMKALRNILIHEYAGVDVKVIWHTAKKYLSPLQKQLILLLKDFE